MKGCYYEEFRELIKEYENDFKTKVSANLSMDQGKYYKNSLRNNAASVAINKKIINHNRQAKSSMETHKNNYENIPNYSALKEFCKINPNLNLNLNPKSKSIMQNYENSKRLESSMLLKPQDTKFNKERETNKVSKSFDIQAIKEAEIRNKRKLSPTYFSTIPLGNDTTTNVVHYACSPLKLFSKVVWF